MCWNNTFSQLDELGLAALLALAGERAPADVAKPASDRLGRVDVDDEQRLLETRRAGKHLTLVVEHDGVSVEDELVLAADEVAEREEGGVVPRARDEHLLAILGLADVVGRGGDVHEQLGAGQREVGRGRPRLPDVLADGGADQRLPEPEQHELAPGREVAILVEDAVVREVALPVDRAHLAVRADGAGIEEVAVEPRRADEGGQAGAGRRDLVERGFGGAHERGSKQEILRGIPRDRELGEEDELGTLPASVCESGENALAVAVQVADDDVDLGEREPHEPDPIGLRLSGKNPVTET